MLHKVCLTSATELVVPMLAGISMGSVDPDRLVTA